MHTAATDGIVGSPGFGCIALTQIARTLPAVSFPSSVVRSIIRMARSSAHSFDAFLIDRRLSASTRSSTPTWSTVLTRPSRLPRGSPIERERPSHARMSSLARWRASVSGRFVAVMGRRGYRYRVAMPTRRAPIRMGLTGAAILVLAFGVAVPAVLAATRGVDIRDFAFSPRTVEIRVGDTVRWTNRDSVAHTATAQNGSFDTGLLAEGESGSIRFTAAGTYRYVCTPHPNMTGTVVVRPAGAGVVPPNTTTAAIADPAVTAHEDVRFALLAALGGVAFLITERLLRRRRRLR